ncbi:MAG: SMP-30/gluconolactonase/LRE family protein [Cytophagaceae bacterium]|nr:SMP-30/gluconolactonase/LRE family protein [Cytophagaceae bacterium]
MNQSHTIQTLATGLNFPEGPAFAPDGSFWAVELKGAGLVNIQSGIVNRYPVGGSPNGIAIDKSGKVWFCDSEQNAIRCFDPATGQTETKASTVAGEPLDKPNDLAFDRAGNLLFTCPGNSRQQPTGYVCVRTPDGEVRKISTDKYFPNGLAFSADGQTLVVAETYRHRLWEGDWNHERGELANAHVWATVEGPQGPGGPDGMAFGDDGNLYVAVYGTGCIHVVSPGGQVIERIELPGRNPTNCAFDPSGQLGLVVTEAEHGQLLSVKTGTSGITLFN